MVETMRGGQQTQRALVVTGVFLVLIGLLGVGAGSAGAQEPELEGWQLTFDEQFEGGALDGSKWVQYEGPQNADDLNHFSPEDLLVQDGTLRLRLQAREVGAKPYTSGGLGTHGKFNQTYGRWEVRARAPVGKGLAPYVALWPDGEGASWPPEVDLFECPAEPRTEAVFTNRFGSADAPEQVNLSAAVDCAGDFHTYTVEWTPDALRWFVDGAEQGAITENVPTTPMAVAMGLTAAGCADVVTGCPDDTTALPAFFEVDAVRVWRQDDPSAPQPSAVLTDTPVAAGDPLAGVQQALEDAATDAPVAQPAQQAAPSPSESATALTALATTGPSGFLTMALATLSVLGGLGLVLWGRSMPARGHTRPG